MSKRHFNREVCKNLVILVGVLFIASASCDKKKDQPSESTPSQSVTIRFTSSTMVNNSFYSQNQGVKADLNKFGPQILAGSSCTVQTDAGGTESGLCYSPIEVSGNFNQANLGSTSGGAPVRILGGGYLKGLEAVFHRAAFNLKTTPSILGDDNIQDGGGQYNIVTLTIQYLETAFTATPDSKVFRVRIPFVSTPPSISSVFTQCGLGGGISEADLYGTLFGNVQAQAKDILVCIKATKTDVCADADYLWVNSDGTTTATRPALPKQVSGQYLSTIDQCTPGADHPDVTWGYFNMDVMLNSPVSVSASFDKGVKTYNVGGKTGSWLTFTVDFNTSNSLFVPTSALSSDLAATTESTILQNIDKILLTPLYIKQRKNNASPGTGDLTATAVASVE
jgi:hypothetical protein